MHRTHEPTVQQALPSSRTRRLLGSLLPAAALGVLVWLAPGESQAAPPCTTKHTVCKRLAALKAARATAPVLAAPRVAAVAQNEKPRCTTKPIVCARLKATDIRPAAPPVTLARGSDYGPRCTTKPAVCARLRVRPNTQPITLASD